MKKPSKKIKIKNLDWRLGFGILGTYHNLQCIEPEFKALIAFDFSFEPIPSANNMLQRIVKLGLLRCLESVTKCLIGIWH